MTKNKRGGKRIGAGRKPSSKPRKKFVTIGFSANETEAGQIAAAALAAGVSVGEWVRMACGRHLTIQMVSF